MQKINVYLQVDGVRGERVDAQGNLQRARAPEITRGMESELLLRLRDAAGNPWDSLEEYAAWEFYVGGDWNPQTPVLLAVTQGITAEEDQVTIPVGNTNSEALAAALGNSEKAGFHAELLGFVSGQGLPALVIQFDIVVRNRVSAEGTEVPAELPVSYLTAGGVTALIAEQTALAAPSITEGGTWQVNGEDTGIFASGVRSVNGRTGVVSLEASDIQAASVEGRPIVTLTSAAVPEPGKVYAYAPSENTTFTFFTPAEGMDNSFVLRLAMPDPAVMIAWPSGLVWKFVAPEPAAGSTSVLMFTWNGTNWEGWAVPDMSKYASSSSLSSKAETSLTNLTAAGKGVIADAALELDYSAMDTPAASVQYQASRAGILAAYGTNNSGSTSVFLVHASPASTVSGYDGYQSGGNLAAGLSQSLCIFVSKGWYYLIASNGTTITGAHFIPFKNSIAN